MAFLVDCFDLCSEASFDSRVMIMITRQQNLVFVDTKETQLMSSSHYLLEHCHHHVQMLRWKKLFVIFFPPVIACFLSFCEFWVFSFLFIYTPLRSVVWFIDCFLYRLSKGLCLPLSLFFACSSIVGIAVVFLVVSVGFPH